MRKNKGWLVIISLVLFFLAAWYFSTITLYFIISMIIATILRPLADYISNFQLFGLKMPRALAVVASFALLFVVISLFVLLFIPLVSEQVEVLRSINYERSYYQLVGPLSSFESFLIEKELLTQEPGFLVENFKNNLFSAIKITNIGAVVNELLSFTGSFFIGFMAVLFISFFLLYEKGLLRKQIISLIPNSYFEMTITAMYTVEKLLSNYLIGLILQMVAIFSLASIGLSIFGIKYALTIAIFAAVANIVPFAGPIAGATFGLIVGLSTFGEIPTGQDFTLMSVKILSVFVVIQVTDNVLLQPLIFSKSVKAHPLEIFIIIFAGATIAGIPGMIAAIPAYTILRVSGMALIDGYKRFRVFKINY